MKRKILALLCGSLMLLSGCGGGGDTVDTPTASNKTVNQQVLWQPFISADWPVNLPAAEGIDEAQLSQAYQTAANSNGSYALLVIRRGQLVGEAYFNGARSTDYLQLRSVTKTVMATLIGLAIEQGKIASVHQPISELLGSEYASLMTDKADITLAHLLTMSAGFSWDENAANAYTDWEGSADPTLYVLQRPMSHNAGEKFNYNSANSHLLSVIISKTTGMNTGDFADQYLFKPLGISGWRWNTLRDGYYNGAAGLQLRARDLAKLGQFWLQQGLWQQQQVVQSSWFLQAMAIARQLTGQFGGLSYRGYGYQWWLMQPPVSTGLSQLAWGYGGQFVLTIPSQDLVVVMLANSLPADVIAQEAALMNLITQQLLPAVH